MIELPLDSSNRYPAALWSRPDAPPLAPGAPGGVSFERQLSKARERSEPSTTAERPTSRDESRDASTDRTRPTDARPDEQAAETSREDTTQADTDRREDQPAETAETSEKPAEANQQEAAKTEDTEQRESPESTEESEAAVSSEAISSNRIAEQKAKPVGDKRDLLAAHNQGKQEQMSGKSAATELPAGEVPSDEATADVAAKGSGRKSAGKAEKATANGQSAADAQAEKIIGSNATADQSPEAELSPKVSEGKRKDAADAADAKRAEHAEPATADNGEQVQTQAVAGEAAGVDAAAKEQKAVDAAPGAKTSRTDASRPSAESAPAESVGQRGRFEPNRAAAATAAASAVNASKAPETEMQSELASGSAAEAVERAGQQGGKPASESNPSSPVEQTARPTPAQAERAGGAAPQTTSGDTLAPSDRVRFVERVARAFQAAGDRGGVIRLRLSPPELGAMRLELVVRDGQMHARMETETQAARQAILDNLPMLRDRLAQQDIRIAQFDVDVSDQSGGGLHDRTADQPPPDRQGSHRHGAGPGRAAKVEAAASDAVSAYRLGDGGRLNIVI